MPVQRDIMCLADKNGVFEHFMVWGNGRSLYCHCDRSIKFLRRRAVACPYTQVLTCPKCEVERQRWASWWESVERRSRENEKGQSEEAPPSA